jgi:hypothetical protein
LADVVAITAFFMGRHRNPPTLKAVSQPLRPGYAMSAARSAKAAAKRMPMCYFSRFDRFQRGAHEANTKNAMNFEHFQKTNCMVAVENTSNILRCRMIGFLVPFSNQRLFVAWDQPSGWSKTSCAMHEETTRQCPPIKPPRVETTFLQECSSVLR